EICLRHERGLPAQLEEYLRRFPQWSKQIRVLFECHGLLGSDPVLDTFPDVGEDFGEFHLEARLGRGANGQGFLATQRLLANRAVVLKITPSDGQEHLSLARLQHTHIVPLYAVYAEVRPGLRALCMPYFGGASLDHVLHALSEVSPTHRTGQHFVRAI